MCATAYVNVLKGIEIVPEAFYFYRFGNLQISWNCSETHLHKSFAFQSIKPNEYTDLHSEMKLIKKFFCKYAKG